MTRCPKCAYNLAGDVVLHCDDHLHEAGWMDLGYVGAQPEGSPTAEYRAASDARPASAKPRALIPDGLLGPHVAHLTGESLFLQELLRRHPPKPMTRRERWALRARSARERVALRFAPWLDREDEW